MKGMIREDELNTNNRFLLKELAYQRIDKYLKPNTQIEYEGQAFTIKYENGRYPGQKNRITTDTCFLK